MSPDPQERLALQEPVPNRVRVRRAGIDTHYEAVVFMRDDCPVCRAEGFTAHARVKLSRDGRSIIATLYQMTSDLLAPAEAALSETAWLRLGLDGHEDGAETITVTHPDPLESLSRVRGKVYGETLDARALKTIITDVVAGRYSDIHLSSFITACSARPLDLQEMIGLTAAMTEAGDRLSWSVRPVVDKHCVGGLPGNRTTPIVVSIVAACGLTMPKTSSRAITSPAGTADAMETLAPVDLDLASMRRVVEQEGGCIVWGGAVRLSPADDTLIRVERALDLDSEGQLIASVLSKKIAAGSTHLVLDLPVGPTAKVRSGEAASALSESLLAVARAFDIEARVLISDGRQPVGHGIGPSLEALDVLAVLQGTAGAPSDLRARSITLAGALLELAGAAASGEGEALATRTLADGRAWAKFQRICEAQGGLREPPTAAHRHTVTSGASGRVLAIDNRRLAKVAKLAGAPDAKAAGVELHVHLGTEVETGEPLYTVHAEAPGELSYSLDYAAANPDMIALSEGR
ncbi:thymidine phosphorylase [Tistlia consotensis]|uniref:Putative thymidine phosphorylase n=1 Tax=Tistlia consotensis USBA 355 TaxID=560819 RepID=A0A1Y6C4K1_9PROT|nr:thymidine phosphorylase family protein [Tistlia consotensis]SMF36067.1 thymidine phosphorylase [Tistlia consotensis USBA 355]SNR71355.1 thymidine phosphorylase [Tistlia consotensis]